MVALSDDTQGGRAKQGFMDQHHFLLRRLHSLTGIVPIGVFLIAHMVTNSSIVWGLINYRGAEGIEYSPDEETMARQVGTFQHEVAFINDAPFLILIELSLWGAIAFHSILGFYYARTGKHNTQRYAYQDNWRYTLQRWSGYIGILFIVYHVGTLRWGWTWLIPGGTHWDHNYAASTTAAVLQGTSWDEPGGITLAGVVVSAFYMLGVTLLIFHFANGLWTAAITWGLTVTAKAQKQWGLACLGLGAFLMVAGWSSVVGFMLTDVDRAYQMEVDILESKGKEVENIRSGGGGESEGAGAGVDGGAAAESREGSD